MSFLVRYILSIIIAVAVLAGCQSTTSDQSLKAEVPTSNLKRIENAQIANGASHDATLYPGHFDGDHLNSLGRQKLDGIITGTANIHIAAPNAPEKQTAVLAYLKDAGYPTDGIHFDDQPKATFAAADGIKNLPRTDTVGGGEQGGYGGSAGNAPSLGSALQALTGAAK